MAADRSDSAVTVNWSEVSGGGAEGGVLPGIGFTVIFSGYNVLKQLSSSDPNRGEAGNVITRCRNTHTHKHEQREDSEIVE